MQIRKRTAGIDSVTNRRPTKVNIFYVCPSYRIKYLIPIAPYFNIGKVVRKFNIQRNNSTKNLHRFDINPLNPELNPICYLLALLGAHHFLHVSRIRVKSLTFRRLMSYIYIIYIYIYIYIYIRPLTC